MYHYKFINPELSINKFRLTAQRLSEENKKNGWGYPQMLRTEEQVMAEFTDERNRAKKIRE